MISFVALVPLRIQPKLIYAMLTFRMMPQTAGPPFVSSAYAQPPTLLPSHAAPVNAPRMGFDPAMMNNPAMGRGQPAGFAGKPPRHAAYNHNPNHNQMMTNPAGAPPRPAAHFAPMATVAPGQPPYQPSNVGPPRPHFTSATNPQGNAPPSSVPPAMAINPAHVPNNPPAVATTLAPVSKTEPTIKAEPSNGTARPAPTLNAGAAGVAPGQRPKDGASATEMTSVNVQRLKVEDALLYLDKVRVSVYQEW
jgi:hypothetical protein